ncbi:MAG: hypothetical protein R3D68_19430 [Hyphomicrobiaceae bacterium]
MVNELDTLKRRLAALGQKIDAKVSEFRVQGALHGVEREAASELQARHARAAARLAGGHTSPGGRLLDEIAGEVAVLTNDFNGWLAMIDKQSES